jgi:hypothetical protein
MSKRLIMVLVFAFAACTIGAAYAEVQNVKVSGDISVYAIGKSQFGLVNHGDAAVDGDNGTLKNETALATITRLRVDADLTDNVGTTVRLINERYWGAEADNTIPGAADAIANTDTSIDLDLAYVSLKDFMGADSPMSLIIGRQELHYGNDMIIGDVDTNNMVSNKSDFWTARPGDQALSARKSFDAIRTILNYDPLVVDVVYAKISEAGLMNSDDANLYGVNAAYKLSDRTNVEGYFWREDTQKKAFVTDGAEGHSKGDNINVIGGRIAHVKQGDSVDFSSQIEGAYQFGNFVDANGRATDRQAWAGEGAITAAFKNMKYTPSLTLLGAYFSGKKDRNTTGGDVLVENGETFSGWDPMYENQKFGDIANQQFDQTNARLIGLIGTAKAADDVMLKGEYYCYWWDVPFLAGDVATSRTNYTYNMTGKRFAGQEVDLSATYDYTEDVQFGVMYGVFFPGTSFEDDNSSIASEIVGSMKVTF